MLLALSAPRPLTMKINLSVKGPMFSIWTVAKGPGHPFLPLEKTTPSWRAASHFRRSVPNSIQATDPDDSPKVPMTWENSSYYNNDDANDS